MVLAFLLALLSTSGCSYFSTFKQRATEAAGGTVVRKGEVIVNGLESAQEQNVKAYLKIGSEPCDAPHWRIKRLYGSANEQIERALKALGYYAPKIAKTAPVFSENCWQATFDIDAGPPVIVRNVTVELLGEASTDPAYGELLESLPVEKDTVLNHALYEKTKTALATLAADRGYIDAEFKRSEIRVNRKEREADIQLIFDSGQRYDFGALTIEQTTLRAELVDRFIAFPPGEPYDSESLNALYRSLVDSGYFGSVEVRPQIDAAKNGSIPVVVHMEPIKAHRYSAGLGFATDTGPRGSLGYENRRINKRGHRLRTNLSLSPTISTVDGSYEIPLGSPASESLRLQAGYKIENTEAVEGTELKLGLSYSTKITNGWLRTAFINFSREDTTVGGEQRIDNLLIPGLRFSKTLADNIIRPTDGYRVNLEVRASPGLIGDSTSFALLSTSLKFVRSLALTKGRFITRGDLGYLLNGEAVDLPASQRFFTGGDNSVRGFRYQSLVQQTTTVMFLGAPIWLRAVLNTSTLFARTGA